MAFYQKINGNFICQQRVSESKFNLNNRLSRLSFTKERAAFFMILNNVLSEYDMCNYCCFSKCDRQLIQLKFVELLYKDANAGNQVKQILVQVINGTPTVLN